MPSLSFLKLSSFFCLASAYLLCFFIATWVQWIHVFLVILISWRLTWLHAHLLQIHVTDVSHILEYHVVLEERTIANLTALRKSAIPSLVAPVLTHWRANLRDPCLAGLRWLPKSMNMLESQLMNIFRLSSDSSSPVACWFPFCSLPSWESGSYNRKSTDYWELLRSSSLLAPVGNTDSERRSKLRVLLSHEQVQADTCCQHHLLEYWSFGASSSGHSHRNVEALRKCWSALSHYQMQLLPLTPPSAFLLPRYQLDWLILLSKTDLPPLSPLDNF